MRIVVATNNQGKGKEFKAILGGSGFEIVGMAEAGAYVDVDEDADTFEGNAVKKALEVMRVCGEITVADDSGLCVDVLGGAPGVYSARYSGEGADDEKNNRRLLEVMKNEKNRKAKFVCVIAAAFPNGEIKTFRGEFDGEIAYEPAGSGGFGYDSLFYLPEYGVTSAQLAAEEKNRISHRAKALALLKEFLSAGR